jgi:alpha-tubulin suppressor-like RCC1 family protein
MDKKMHNLCNRWMSLKVKIPGFFQHQKNILYGPLVLMLVTPLLFVSCTPLTTTASQNIALTAKAMTQYASGEITNWIPGSVQYHVQVQGLSGVIAIACSTALDVESGSDYGLALKSDGTVWSWTMGGLAEITTRASQVNGLSRITAISTGFGNSLALDSNGKVWSWGDNFFGQFGVGVVGGGDQFQGITTTPPGSSTTTTFTIQQPVQVTGLNKVIAISSGLRHCLALESNGTVWAWGDNEWGQLGDGTTTDHYVPIQVESLSGIIAISAGHYHSLALKSDGTVWAWGNNESGELGNGTNINSNVPVEVQGLKGIKAIAAGEAHSMALKSDGTVWTWGNNENGQEGNDTQNNEDNPGTVNPIEVPYFQKGGVVAIAEGGMPGGGPSSGSSTVLYGGGYCLALLSDGDVASWGSSFSNVYITPGIVTVLNGITAIAGGGDWAAAISK